MTATPSVALPEPWSWGGRSERPRTVIVYGNCQAPFVAAYLSLLDDLDGDYRFVFAANHVLPGETRPRPLPERWLDDVALVLDQHEDHVACPEGRAWRAQVPDSVPVVRYPTFLLNALWPFECPDPRAHPEDRFPYTRYPHGDMIALEIAGRGLRGALAVGAYLELSAQRMPNLAVRLARDFDRMRRHDARCDVHLGDYVEANFRREHLFWNYGHVSRNACRELARRVADAARPVLGGTAARAAACFAAYEGAEGMGDHQPPIHPLVAETFGLAYCSLDRKWRWYDQQWTFFEYYERYIAYDTSW